MARAILADCLECDRRNRVPQPLPPGHFARCGACKGMLIAVDPDEDDDDDDDGDGDEGEDA